MTPHLGSHLAVLAALLAGPLGAQPALVFTDISAAAGVEAAGINTESLAWGDYDDDGDPDLYLTHQDVANQLLRNDGGGTFTRRGTNVAFTDVTASAGVGHQGWSVGAAWGDLDNDGDLDLYVVSFGGAPDALYRNDGPVGPGGGHVFTDLVADPAFQPGTTELSSSRGVTLVDYDRDSLLDIYVNAIGPDILYHNLGGLSFTNVAGVLGIASNDGQGVGVVASDLDDNGWPDLFTGNRSFDVNRLYMNRGGTFTDVDPLTSGIDAVGLGMGVVAFDYDNDLDMDLYWTAWPGTRPELVDNAFYENVGGGTFVDVTGLTGTEDTFGWGISCNTGDIDNDGWEDFAVTNGFSPDSTANVLLRNNGGLSFSDVTSVLGGADFDGRGVAFADFDLDGDLDLVITGGPDATTRLWRNDTPSDHHWITVKLVGTVSNRSAVGTRVTVTTNLHTTVKEVASGAGRGSGNDLPLEFGLGRAARIREIVIRWPNGLEQRILRPGVDQLLTVTEPSFIFKAPRR